MKLYCIAQLVLAIGLGSLTAGPDIVFPTKPTVPNVMPPAPIPSGKLVLGVDDWYVFSTPEDYSVKGYPTGLVRIEAKKGPRDISAKFVDGKGIVEDRSYDGPKVWIIRAMGKGECTIVVTPKNWKTEDEIKTDIIDVGGVVPKPVDPVDPVLPPAQKSFRVIFVVESMATYSADVNGVLYGADIRKWLKDNTTPDGEHPGYRLYDKDQTNENDLPGVKALWSAAKPLVTTVPCIVVEVNGKAEIIPVPPFRTALDELKKYKAKQ